MIHFRKAQYLCSAWKIQDLPVDTGKEVAFAGRSNSGKSTLINTLSEQTRLARVSKMPGRTQALHFFHLAENMRLVDLPGYGYAKAGIELKKKWLALIEAYLDRRKSLQGVCLLMDIRHPLKETDRIWIDWMQETTLKLHIILTKSDKMSKGEAKSAIHTVQKCLPGVSMQTLSSSKKIGLDTLKAQLTSWLTATSN